MQSLMEGNKRIAEENRAFFREQRISAVNVMASPGAGKTSLILRIMEELAGKCPVAVIEGDIASTIDAEKIEKAGASVFQINTAGGCHLDANMIKRAVDALAPPKDSILFIENVGNLVCPSSFDLGENVRLVVSSVPEGDDKPYKYVPMFEVADAVVLGKMDLLPHIDFNKDYFYRGIRTVKPDIPVFELSCKLKTGITPLVSWLRSR
jgi:hydrogenase nickel incorporation protein HypB